MEIIMVCYFRDSSHEYLLVKIGVINIEEVYLRFMYHWIFYNTRQLHVQTVQDLTHSQSESSTQVDDIL